MAYWNKRVLTTILFSILFLILFALPDDAKSAEEVRDIPIGEFETVSEPTKERVPGWFKNSAKWWSEGKIGDSDFVNGIQFMIKHKIINIPNLPEQSSATAQEHIPDWIKNNAGWWANGLISEDDFVSGIKWLVENRIIKV